MIKEKVLETIKKYNLIEPKDKIVLGVSGGPDSISMLIILNELSKTLDFEIVVCHVNHGIRENAILDEEYVKKWCEKLNVEFYCLHSKVKTIAEEKKLGLEETGRKVRYDFFNEIAKKTSSNKIAIAHNKNDNSETMIMNLLRGSGTNGLRGIEAKQGRYIRPLIEVQRQEIEEFCIEEKLEPRIDESNFENEFTRNKIRNIVIPFIKKEFNPNIIDTLERLAEIIREEENFVNLEAQKNYNKILIQEINLPKFEYNKDEYNSEKEATIILNLKEFNHMDIVLQKKVLLIAIQKIFGSIKGIEKVHLDDMIKLCNKNIGNKYLTPNKNLKIVIKNKQIHISSINTSIPSNH
jgi:tRNA(Ile)-lysidine synthase